MKNRRKTAFFVALTAIALAGAAFVQLAFAQTRHPGLLPNNPFYFVKDALWQLRRALVIDESAKAELEIKFLRQKGAEIKKLLQLRPQDSQSLEVATTAYRQSLELLKQYLKNSNGDLRPNFLRWALNQSLFFAQVGLNDLRNEVLELLLFYFDRQEMMAALEEITNPLKELMAAELFQAGMADLEVAKFYEDLLLIFAARVKDNQIAFDDLLIGPGNLLLRLQVLDEARQRVGEAELKSKFNLWRQKILERAGGLGLTTGGVSKAFINNLSRFQLTNQAKYLFDQGRKLFEEGNYLGAYGYLISSQAVLNDELFQTALAKEGLADEIALLKKIYDEVAAESDKEQTAALNVLANRIAVLSDLARSKPKSDELLNGIREVKLLLFQLQ